MKAAVSEAKEKRDSLIKDLSEKTKGLCDAASKEESKRKIKQLHSECKRRLERWCEDYIKYIKGMKEGEQTDMSGVRKIMNQLNSAIHDYDEATADVMDEDIGPNGINLDFTRRRRRK